LTALATSNEWRGLWTRKNAAAQFLVEAGSLSR
jgi:hypothetical protein